MNCNTNLLNGDGGFGAFCLRYVLKNDKLLCVQVLNCQWISFFIFFCGGAQRFLMMSTTLLWTQKNPPAPGGIESYHLPHTQHGAEQPTLASTSCTPSLLVEGDPSAFAFFARGTTMPAGRLEPGEASLFYEMCLSKAPNLAVIFSPSGTNL